MDKATETALGNGATESRLPTGPKDCVWGSQRPRPIEGHGLAPAAVAGEIGRSGGMAVLLSVTLLSPAELLDELLTDPLTFRAERVRYYCADELFKRHPDMS